MVFYRKYRPQTIEELDSFAVRETLTSVLAKSPPHAFLFTGPKGLGKTSAARIVAKVINCTGRKLSVKNIEPCNTCEQCVSITNGTNLDVLEIDAASNRGIDEIRDLKEKIRLSPLSAKRKVYIIDEVHMLTTEAFNALLKTLEEPPSHAIFILCTTEPQKIPPTILSRCFHITFSLATKEELVRSFERIVRGEKIEAEKEALLAIAELSEGGFRDGTKIIEELATVAKSKPLTLSLVEERYKVTSTKYYSEALFSHLAKRDISQVLVMIEKLVKDGVDIKQFVASLMGMLHQMLLQEAGVKDRVVLRQSSGQELKVKSATFTIEEIRGLTALLMRAHTEFRNAVVPQLPLEIALIEWVQTQRSSESNSGEFSEKGKGNVKVSGIKDTAVSVSGLRRHVGNIAKIKALYGDTVVENADQEIKEIVTTSVSILNFSADGEITKEWMDVLWQSIISQMKSHNHTIAGVLRGCIIKSYDRKDLIIETAYKFHKEKLDQGKTREVLEEVCQELTGKPVNVSVVLKSN